MFFVFGVQRGGDAGAEARHEVAAMLFKLIKILGQLGHLLVHEPGTRLMPTRVPAFSSNRSWSTVIPVSVRRYSKVFACSPKVFIAALMPLMLASEAIDARPSPAIGCRAALQSELAIALPVVVNRALAALMRRLLKRTEGLELSREVRQGAAELVNDGCGERQCVLLRGHLNFIPLSTHRIACYDGAVRRLRAARDSALGPSDAAQLPSRS